MKTRWSSRPPFESGLGLDLSLGYDRNVVRPEGAADSVIKWGVTLLFP